MKRQISVVGSSTGFIEGIKKTWMIHCVNKKKNTAQDLKALLAMPL